MVANTFFDWGTAETPSGTSAEVLHPGQFPLAQADRAGSHLRQGENGLQQRRLAGPVRPENNRDLARLDRQRNVSR